MMNKENEAFSEGVRPGGVTQTDQILVLLCVLIRESEMDVKYKALQDAIMQQELVNYFELSAMMEKMTEKGYMTKDGDGADAICKLTTLGQKTAEDCKFALPNSVLRRAQKELYSILIRERRLKENDIRIENGENGYLLCISMKDNDRILLDMKIPYVSRTDCEIAKEHFLEGPAEFYWLVLSSLNDGLLKNEGDKK